MRHSRLDDIMRILNAVRQVSVEELTARLGVSEVTVRKDLNYLQDLGRLRRTRGGAVIVEDYAAVRPLPSRREEHLAEKEAIAGRAAALVKPDDAVYVDAGSTCARLVSHLIALPLHVVTNSLDAIVGLAAAPDIALHAAGGNLRRDAGSFIGPSAVRTIASVRVDIAFLGATGISHDGVFSSENAIEADVKRAVVQSARRRVVLADSRKLGAEAFAVFARAGDIDLLITNDGKKAREFCELLGIETIFV